MTNFLKDLLGRSAFNQPQGAIHYGKMKLDGGHDHRTNRNEDRTPAQKAGDEKRKKP